MISATPNGPFTLGLGFSRCPKVHGAHIGKKVRIRNLADRPDSDSHSDKRVARDGLVVVKNATIPDGTEI